MTRFICWQDINNYRGYIPESSPHTYKQVGSNYYFEAFGVTAQITTQSNIFIVTKLEQALNWVKTGNDTGRLAETCAEKGIN
jgi:hypothetical protein